MSKKNVCEIEKRIFDYKLKEINAWRTPAFIIEVKGKAVCKNRNNAMVLSDAPFPTEFSNAEVHQVKKVIAGAEPKIYSVREWYKKQLQSLTRVVLAIQ